MLPNHPPEISDCVGHRTLGSDVGIRPVVTLRRKSEDREGEKVNVNKKYNY